MFCEVEVPEMLKIIVLFTIIMGKSSYLLTAGNFNVYELSIA